MMTQFYISQTKNNFIRTYEILKKKEENLQQIRNLPRVVVR